MRRVTLQRARAFSLAILAAASLGAASAAQTVDRAIPEAASPGDLLILRGSNLGSTTTVDFTAFVGGFAGILTSNVVPLTVTSTEITVIVPSIGAFVPPPAPMPGTPFGLVKTDSSTNELDFFFTEGSQNQVASLGTGTTQSSGQKPVISFDLLGGAPDAGNNGFVFRLENAVPGSIAFFAVSAPFPVQPYPAIGDGTLTLALSPLWVFQGPLIANAQGDVDLPQAIPAGVSITVAAQWGLLPPTPGPFGVSNGMRIIL